jgi:hypothetical protein
MPGILHRGDSVRAVPDEIVLYTLNTEARTPT